MRGGSDRPGLVASGLPAAVRVALAAGAALASLHLLLVLVAGEAAPPLLEAGLEVATYLVAVGLLWARVLVRPANRLPWAFFAVGMTAWTAGVIAFSAVVQHLEVRPYPSIADLFWFAFYPCAYAAIALLLWSGVADVRPTVWLDGILAALALSAGFVGLLSRPLLAAGDAEGAAVFVNLVYPIADLVLFALVSAGGAVLGWRFRGSLALLGVGMLAFTFGDVVYLLQESASGYTPMTWVDDLWLVAVLFVALAAWRDVETPPVARHEGRLLLAQPIVFLVTSDALLVHEAVQPDAADPVVVVLASLAVVVACLRMAITLRQVRSLGEARRLAHTDELTGLANRRRFSKELDALDADGARFAVLLLDLNGFKEVNDTFGHAVGDQLLAAVAVRLRRTVALRGGVCARMGGDEFGVLLPEAGGEAAVSMARDVAAAVREPVHIRGFLLRIDASIGVASSPADGNDASTLLRRADSAMYRAKRLQVGVASYEAGVDEDTPTRLRTLEELREALELGQIVPYYQPQIDLRTGALRGFEALARWHHPRRGVLAPEVFLPLAEQAGLMPALTHGMLARALRDVARWRRDGHQLVVAVNVGRANLEDVSFPEAVADLLRSADVPGEALKCEITEDTLMADAERQRTVGHLDDLGVSLSVDDFGRGYSSLGVLPTLPIRELKLDRDFVHRMPTDPAVGVIVESTIDLAHRLGVAVLAEGIETAEQLEQLRAWRCDRGQGDLLGRPLAPTEVDAWIAGRGAMLWAT